MRGTDRRELADADKRAGAVLSKAWRTSNKLNQGDAADLLDVSQSTLSDWEAGAKEPSIGLAFLFEKVSGGTVPASSWPVTWRQWKRASAKTGT